MNTIALIFSFFNPRKPQAPPPPAPVSEFEIWLKGYPRPQRQGADKRRRRRAGLGQDEVWTTAKKVRRSSSVPKPVKLERRQSESEQSDEQETSSRPYPASDDEVLYKSDDPNDDSTYCIPKSPYTSTFTSRTSSSSSLHASIQVPNFDVIPQLSLLERQNRLKTTVLFGCLLFSLFVILVYLFL